uniref:protein-serine/threonine phosphatase n=1 Tax=Neobodo designis TaxID=312471 RepID=A0A7S1M8T0_NEODS|mmetsp:Transcript_3599/g.11258  ORF Transcript_3599/g.11258 Transcript_3599/m.11258 type:complete len:488 (+) Transcript_3599:154-1617(+)
MADPEAPIVNVQVDVAASPPQSVASGASSPLGGAASPNASLAAAPGPLGASSSLSVPGRPGGGRRRSAAIRGASKEDVDREPLLAKANREEHITAVVAPTLRMALVNLQGWRKNNEDAHVCTAIDATSTISETRAPGSMSMSTAMGKNEWSPTPSPARSPLGPAARKGLEQESSGDATNAEASAVPLPPPQVVPPEPADPESGDVSPAVQLVRAVCALADPDAISGGAEASEPVRAVMGIFDGHNGRDAAAFVAARLAVLIGDGVREAQVGDSDGRVARERDAIAAAFQRCDDEMRDGGGVGASGSTAACAVLTHSHVHLCSAGDCRIAATDADGAIVASITQDHTPGKNASECDRVAALGVSLENGRVDGKLAVTRAFGDFAFKPAGKPVSQHPVICTPAIESVARAVVRDVVLGCDGVWELNEIPDVAKSVAAAPDILEAASRVAHASCATNRPLNPLTMALSPGSDNITVGIIRLFDEQQPQSE